MRFNSVFILAVTLTLVGCGEGNQTPVAYKPVMASSLDGDILKKNPSKKPLTLLESVIAQGVPKTVAITGFAKYDEFKTRISKQGYMTLIDYTQHSSEARLFMINMDTGNVDKLVVAHGVGSDPDDTGFAKLFGNVYNSKKTALGAYLINEVYDGKKFGEAMRLDGLEASNNLARDRGIVMHRAKYVSFNRNKQGRSWGCPALPLNWINRAIARLRDGSFLYSYGKASKSPAEEALDLQLLLADPNFHMLNESEDSPEDGEE